MAKPSKIPSIAGTRSVVGVDSIHPDPKNPNRQSKFIYGKLQESIKRFGFTDPVIVREDPDGGLMIVGGEHRWKAAKQLGMTEVPIVNLGVVPDAEAHMLMVVLNETKGQADEDLLSALVNEVHLEVGDDIHILPYTDARLAELLDDVAPPPVEEEPENVEPPKLKASDLWAVLELKGITQDECRRFLSVIAEWSEQRSPKTRPAWMDLRILLEKRIRDVNAAADKS